MDQIPAEQSMAREGVTSRCWFRRITQNDVDGDFWRTSQQLDLERRFKAY